MTYAEFVRDCLKKQRAYIRSEERRYKKALALWCRYDTAMRAMGIHPLNREEIYERQRELERMKATLPETHGDTALMQSLYRMHTTREATP